MKSDYSQTCVKDAMIFVSYVNKVKGHLLRSKVNWRQVETDFVLFFIFSFYY